MNKIINKYSLPIYIVTLILCFVIGAAMEEHKFYDIHNIGGPIVEMMYKIPVLSFVEKNISVVFHIWMGMVYLLSFAITYVVVALIIITLYVTGNTKIHIIAISTLALIAILNSLNPWRPSGEYNMYWIMRTHIQYGWRNSINYVIVVLALDLFNKHIQPKLK